MVKKVTKKIIIFNMILIIIIITCNYFGLKDVISNYIICANDNNNFKDLLSVTITILTVFIGFIVTIATVFISMCDKRIIKLLNEYKKIDYLLSAIKKSIRYGLISLIGTSIIFISGDFNILKVRFVMIYIILNCLYMFISNSTLLVSLINKILSDSLKGNDTIKEEIKFKKPD